ncbi:MAG: protein DA1 [Chloroflexia bacterium]
MLTATTKRGNWCGACGERLAGREMVRLRLGGDEPEARYYCASCADGLLRCAGCGCRLAELPGSLFAPAGQTRRLYCVACWDRPHCNACGHPVGEVSYRRADGRVFCESCHATAVYDPTEAVRLYERVKATAAGALGLTLNVGAVLHMVNREQITALRNSTPGAGPMPDGGEEGADLVGLFVHGSRLRSIYVEYGLPRIFFCEVLAHEYAHAWQAENAPLLSDPELREGFAEWVAYKVVESWGCRLRLERFRGRQDVYGAGLRRLLTWEAAEGVDGLLDRIRRER